MLANVGTCMEMHGDAAACVECVEMHGNAKKVWGNALKCDEIP